jgi:hypothetical protein
MIPGASDQSATEYAFVSYSRREFYFAESLALGLQQHGAEVWFDMQRLQWGADWREAIRQGLEACSSLVLIASRASLASKYVEAEWRTALTAGKPIHVALFEEVVLPADLLSAARSIVDFRSKFDHALPILANAVHSDVVHHDPVPRPRSLPLPGRTSRDVRLVELQLLVSSVLLLAIVVGSALHALASLPDQSGFDRGNTLALIVFFGSIFGVVSCVGLYRWWTFIRRRFDFREMQYAALVQPMFAGIAALFATWSWPWSLPPPPGTIALVVSAGLLLLLGFYNLSFPLDGSADLFRWSATGEAPEQLRRKSLESLLGDAKSAPGVSLGTGRVVRPFQLHYCAADASLALKVKYALLYWSPYRGGDSLFDPKWWRVIRERILRRKSPDIGRQPSQVPGRVGRPQRPMNEVLHIVVLSNKTPKVLVESLLTQHGKLVAVVGSGIQIPTDVSELSRYQWVDYRTRSNEQLSVLWHFLRDIPLGQAGYSLNPVPESLQKHVVSVHVAFLTKYLQVSMGYALGLGSMELLLALAGFGLFMTPWALGAMFAAGLMQFFAVGLARARATTLSPLATLLIGSVVLMAVSGRFEPRALLLQMGAALTFTYVLANWLPTDTREALSGPTLAPPADRIWRPHVLFVAALVLLYVVPIGIIAVIGRLTA